MLIPLFFFRLEIIRQQEKTPGTTIHFDTTSTNSSSLFIPSTLNAGWSANVIQRGPHQITISSSDGLSTILNNSRLYKNTRTKYISQYFTHVRKYFVINRTSGSLKDYKYMSTPKEIILSIKNLRISKERKTEELKTLHLQLQQKVEEITSLENQIIVLNANLESEIDKT